MFKNINLLVLEYLEESENWQINYYYSTFDYDELRNSIIRSNNKFNSVKNH